MRFYWVYSAMTCSKPKAGWIEAGKGKEIYLLTPLFRPWSLLTSNVVYGLGKTWNTDEPDDYR
jgi:hypothetical protein